MSSPLWKTARSSYVKLKSPGHFLKALVENVLELQRAMTIIPTGKLNIRGGWRLIRSFPDKRLKLRMTLEVQAHCFRRIEKFSARFLSELIGCISGEVGHFARTLKTIGILLILLPELSAIRNREKAQIERERCTRSGEKNGAAYRDKGHFARTRHTSVEDMSVEREKRGKVLG